MVSDIELQQLTHGVLDLLNSRVAKLEHFATVRTDEVVMLFITIRLFVECQIFPELVPFYQITTHEQIQGVVHRGPAYAVALIFHVDIQRFCIEVIVSAVDFFEYGKAFRRLAKAVIFEVGSEHGLHLLNGILFISRIHVTSFFKETTKVGKRSTIVFFEGGEWQRWRTTNSQWQILRTSHSVMRFTFKKTERLKSRKTIGRMFAEGQSFGMYPLRLVFLKKEEVKDGTPVQFGVTVPKRSFKSAVARNKLKRKVRESWRLNKHRLNERMTGLYAFMVIYVAKEDLPYDVIEKAMQAMIRRFIKNNVPSGANQGEGKRSLS